MATPTEIKGILLEKTEAERDEMLDLVRAKHRNLTDLEIRQLYHLAMSYGLDPNRREIWAVKYGTAPATIFVGRDGLLAIGHKTGQLDGLETMALVQDETGAIHETMITYPGAKLIGASCTIWRKDMSHPIKVAVPIGEYNTKKGNWATMPETMIKKVAEAHALRRAFSVHGLYIPEEMDQAQEPPPQEPPAPISRKVQEKTPEKTLGDLDEAELEKIMEPMREVAGKIAEKEDISLENVLEDMAPNLMQKTLTEAREIFKKLRRRLKA